MLWMDRISWHYSLRKAGGAHLEIQAVGSLSLGACPGETFDLLEEGEDERDFVLGLAPQCFEDESSVDVCDEWRHWNLHDGSMLSGGVTRSMERRQLNCSGGGSPFSAALSTVQGCGQRVAGSAIALSRKGGGAKPHCSLCTSSGAFGTGPRRRWR